MSEGYHMADEVHQRAYDARLMRRLLAYIRPYRTWMIIATILLLAAALLSNLTPLLTMRAIDSYISTHAKDAGGAISSEVDSQPNNKSDKYSLQMLILVIGAIMFGETIIRYAQMLIVAVVGQKTMMAMRVQLFSHLQDMSLRFLDKHPTGRLMTRVTDDVEKIQQTIVDGAVQVISDLFMILVVLGFMFSVNWRLTLVTLSTVPFVFLVSALFRRYARKSYLEIRRKVARLNAYMQENIAGMRIVQVFTREEHNFEEFKKRNADLRDEWFRQVLNYALYFPAVDFLGALSIALIILYGGTQIIHSHGTILGQASIGMFLAYVQWAERLFAPVRALADRYNLLLEAMASSERVFELLDTPEDIQDKPGALPCASLRGSVSFQDVWFAYESERWVLKGIKLDIAPGERVAVVGYTGAGKTSLISVLSRFYDIQRGAILIDNTDIRDYQQVALRKRIGAVLQDVFLFSGTIRDNISLGDTTMSDDRIRAAAEYVNAASFIDRLRNGYDYDVGERGCNLSMGQRQLLAFARVIAYNPEILLLDEATSSVDTETEALIQDAIAKVLRDRTCIIIAHRLSTVQHADRIVVMHHGEIRETGSHQQLLAQRGLYYTLYRLQYGGSKVF